MNKLFRVLLLLGICLGLGVSCAAAANPVISLNPQNFNLQPGSTQNVEIVMSEIPSAGFSGYNITISIQDPNIAEITEVSFPSWATFNSNDSFPSSSGWIQAVDANKKVNAGATNVLLGTITLKGKKDSTSAITLSSDDVEDENGDLLTVGFTSGTINPKSPAKTPVITWDNPADIYNGTALDATQLNAIAKDPDTAANVAGTFVYNPPTGTILNVGTHKLNVTFTPNDAANYTSASKEVTINISEKVKKTPMITWNNPADIYSGTALSTTQLNAVAKDPDTAATVAGTLVYTPPAETILSTGTHTLHVEFTPTDTANYTTASKDVSINVGKVTPTITWSNPADINAGTALSSTQLNAVASVPGTLVYTPAAGTVLSTGTHTLHVEFTPTDAANYTTASKDVSINVGKVTPTITWSNPADIKAGTALSSTQLNAIASVPGNYTYDPAEGAKLDVGTHTLHVDFIPTDAINYTNASKDVTINVTQIEKKTPTITWSNPANITIGTALSSTQLNAIASVPGNYTYDPAEGAKLDVGTHTLHVDFIPTDAINYTNASKDVSINVGKVTPTITWSKPADIKAGTALSSTQLNAVASVPGTLVYTPTAGTVLSAGTHTLHVEFTPTDTASYTNASKDVSINVRKVTPTIIWSNPADINAGTALSSTQLNAVASVPGTLVYTPPAGTIPNVGTQKLNVTVTPNDAANYNTASKEVTINVIEKVKKTPTITWNNPADIYSGTALSATQLNAVAKDPDTAANVAGTFVYNPPAGTILNVGTQELNVTVTPNDAANYNTASKEVTINVKENTILQVKANFDFKVTDLKIDFTDNSTGTPTQWKWDFGDGNTLTVQNPEHIYAAAGTYTVKLSVQNNDGSTDIISKSITVREPSSNQLKAAFDATPTSGIAPLTVKFTDRSTNAASIKWDFGDKCGSSTMSNPSYTYRTAGTYTVTLTAYNGEKSNVATKVITVNSAALKINAIKADVTRGNEPLTVRFSSDVSGKPISYTWIINKQTIKGSTNGKLTYTFTKAGKYDVTLVVKDASRHTYSVTKSGFITVLPRVKPPVAAFSATPTSGKAPLPVHFIDKSQNKPDTWQWNFGDGSTSYKQTPTHNYKYPGKYTVTLTVKNKGGSNTKAIKNYIVVNRR